jgi:metal-responsive CopG/Arc/MetJ family transcriptional regulator
MTMLRTISVKLPADDVRRIPARNRSAFIREAVREKLGREEKVWKPKTKFGRKLVAMREEYIAKGGKLVTAEEIAAEIRENRGGMA